MSLDRRGARPFVPWSGGFGPSGNRIGRTPSAGPCPSASVRVPRDLSRGPTHITLVGKRQGDGSVLLAYRHHSRNLLVAVALWDFLPALALAHLRPNPWVVAFLPLAASLAAGIHMIAEAKRARSLGSIVLDDDGIRRVRGDGRVIAAVRWEELRRIVVDRRERMALLEGTDANTLLCQGPSHLLGGVGIERYEKLLAEVAARTGLPLTVVESGGSRRSAAEAPRCGHAGEAQEASVGSLAPAV